MKNQSRLAIISQTSIFYIEKQSLIPIIPSNAEGSRRTAAKR